MPERRTWPKESTCCGADDLADLGQMAALGDHHDAVVLAVIVVVLEQRADVVDVDFLLGNEDDVRAAGDARGIGDPAGVAAHDFNDDHAIVRVGRGVNAVDCLGGDHDRGVVAEGCVGAADVVVDGLGNADGVDAVFAEEQRDRLRVVAAESDERVDLVGLEDFLHLVDAAGNLLHVGARGMQDGAALQLNAVNVFERERNEIVIENAAPAVQKADEFVAVVVDALSDGRINDRIQSGAIAAAGQ